MTLVCFAVKEEAHFFNERTARLPNVQVLLTGMGRRRAEQTIRAALARGQPGLVVSSGFAGGLRPELAPGTVVFAVDGQDGPLAAALSGAGAVPARFHCAERVATTAEQKRALRQATGADAVEMESQVITAVCRECQVPSATVRVVLDSATEDLPLDFNELLSPDQQLDNAKLALAVAKSPGKIPALLRLQRQGAEAARRLAEVLERVLTGGGK